MTIAYKLFKSMKANTSKRISFYTQGQQGIARILLTVWLLANGSPEGALATPKRQPAMVLATTTSPGEPSLASTPPTPPPGGILPLPPDSPGSFWGGSVASTPARERTLQKFMSQEAVPFRECDLLRTSPKVTPVSENFSFEARGGESVRFHYQQGQWHAEVSSHIGAFSRQSVLPVVCSRGEDIASSLEVLSRYPRWYSQRQIHVLDRNVCPTLGEVVYVGELGLKGGGQVYSFDSSESQSELLFDPREEFPEEGDCLSPVDQLKALASDPQIDQQPDKLAELGEVLLKLAASKQRSRRLSRGPLPLHRSSHLVPTCAEHLCKEERHAK